MQQYSPYPGTFDILPDNHKYLTFLKKVFRHEFRKNGFRRIAVPIIESKSLLNKDEEEYIIPSGDFDFIDDLSIGILRAYLDNNEKDLIQPVYYYYMKQFYQKTAKGLKGIEAIGAEIVGEDDPILDAIEIYVTQIVLNKIGLEGKFEIFINSLGVPKEREKYKEELLSFYESKKHILTPISQSLLSTNPILILNSEDEDEKILNSSAPQFASKYLKKENKDHYIKFKEYLDILDIKYIEDNTLVVEKEYQTNSIWQFRALDSRIISRGFRHNLLSKYLGEVKEVPAVGFYLDTSVVIEMLIEYGVKIKNKDKIDLFFVQLGDEAKSVVLPLSLKAREAGINTVVSLGTPAMKEQMLKAQRSKAKYIVIVGIMEARSGIFQVRNEEDGTQEEVKKEDLIDYIIDKIGKENLDFYSPEKDFIIE